MIAQRGRLPPIVGWSYSYLEKVDAATNTSKWWSVRVEVNPNVVRVWWGRIGSKPSTQAWSFFDLEQAIRFATTRRLSKVRAGYDYVDDSATRDIPRNIPQRVARIAAPRELLVQVSQKITAKVSQKITAITTRRAISMDED